MEAESLHKACNEVKRKCLLVFNRSEGSCHGDHGAGNAGTAQHSAAKKVSRGFLRTGIR
jgi:hypothetical protein